LTNTRVIDKYLANYAEAEAEGVGEAPRTWNHAVCIPACAEGSGLLGTLGTLRSARGASEALVIIVVNGRCEAPGAVHEQNQATLASLREACGVGDGPISWGTFDGLGILVVDRASQGRCFPPKQGVGLARKIAGDIALALIRRGVIRHPWIRCTDADVQVPADYFEQLPAALPGTSAAITPFVHTPEGPPHQQQAMGIYDAYLQSYVDGLTRAGSPYAFHTIGSLISVGAHSYAVVRGIPKRLAGEDFYLLNKLAKVGRVHTLLGDPVCIRGRLSDRVPFGTGAALTNIGAALQSDGPIRAYDPRVFEGVGHWLTALRQFSVDADLVRLKATIAAVAEPIGPVLAAGLHAMGAFEAAGKASQQVCGDLLYRRLMEWNDAFRTLKLVHALRDGGIC
jgi:hypothetical protein